MLKIKTIFGVRKNDSCNICGKDADYRVTLTTVPEETAVCNSCLSDRLNTVKQSFMMNDLGSALQSYHSKSDIFVVRVIRSREEVKYSISFQPEGVKEPCAIISGISGEAKAKKALKMVNPLIPWSELFTDRENHIMWEAGAEEVQRIKRELGI